MKRNQRGFSLVELMVVVAIIGILAALAVPRFRNFQAKARQAEVKTNLSHIYTLQESFYADADTYAPTQALSAAAAQCNVANAIGFSITDCTRVRYAYRNVLNNANSFTAFGLEINGGDAATRRVFPGCGAAPADEWQINDQKLLQSTLAGNPATGALSQCL